MCGIAGIINPAGNSEKINLEILKNMTDVITHRGPDSEGQWISVDNKCGLGFRRLSIIDLSDAGSQPMHTPDGRYSIVFNGEIYNHLEIRKELEKIGYKYSSGTDTETILYGYAEWGKGILVKMRGMWDFAIYDSQEHKLFASRDRIGIKPFYFANYNGVFVFGSEIKSILQHPSIPTELNAKELPNYLNLGMSSQKTSLFKHIQKLSAGHYLEIDKNGEINVQRYWSPLDKSEESYHDWDQKKIQTHLIELLRSAIDDRMMSDVPFGVFLSGGIDSSLNVALMAELMDRPIDTYTVGFKELEEYNELEYARIISKRYKTNHHEILIDERESIDVLEKLVWHEDEPNADPVCIPLYFLCKLTKESGTTVVQVGEGSDEQFVGYKWMMRDLNFYNSYYKKFAALPAFMKKGTYGLAKPIFESQNQYLALDYLRRATFDKQFYMSGVSIISPAHQQRLFKSAHSDLTNIPDEYAEMLHSEALKIKPDADLLQRMFFVEQQHRLAETLLMRVDKIGMAHSLEARVPFLDNRIVEFTTALSPQQKIPDKSITKYILKKAVEDILPHEIIYRKKQGFWAPVSEWLKDQWYDFAKEEILNSDITKEYFDSKFIEKMFELHRNGKKKYSTELFSLLNLSIWHKRFF